MSAKLSIEVVGKRPQHQPYLRITDESGDYITSLDEDEMLTLRDAITAATSRRYARG